MSNLSNCFLPQLRSPLGRGDSSADRIHNLRHQPQNAAGQDTHTSTISVSGSGSGSGYNYGSD